MYKRSMFITTVNRIGRNPTLLRVASQTRIDRESYIHKAKSGDLRQRIAAAASSAVDVTFDLVAFKDLTLAGFGPSATFHFAGSGLKTLPASPLIVHILNTLPCGLPCLYLASEFAHLRTLLLIP